MLNEIKILIYNQLEAGVINDVLQTAPKVGVIAEVFNKSINQRINIPGVSNPIFVRRGGMNLLIGKRQE